MPIGAILVVPVLDGVALRTDGAVCADRVEVFGDLSIGGWLVARMLVLGRMRRRGGGLRETREVVERNSRVQLIAIGLYFEEEGIVRKCLRTHEYDSSGEGE